MEKTQKLDRTGSINLPAMLIPSFRTAVAIENGVDKKLLFKTWGGIGDQICAEPTLRFALKNFKGCKISLASEQPELFSHLEFDEVFDLKKVKPIEENYLVFETIQPQNHIVWQFMSHMITNCVDYPSLCALRCQLPIEERTVRLPPGLDQKISTDKYVVIHAGRHWQSKTFPKSFWDTVISEVKNQGCLPVLIGANSDENRGTVDVDNTGCLDLRNLLSLTGSISILKNAKVLLTNDSSPLHMAVDSECHIGFVATCKHPDYIMHYRKNENGKSEFGWRMKNFGTGGVWEHLSYCPNAEQDINAENVGDLLLKWLPDPIEFAKWACEKAKELK
jgi:hypothetical protein